MRLDNIKEIKWLSHLCSDKYGEVFWLVHIIPKSSGTYPETCPFYTVLSKRIIKSGSGEYYEDIYSTLNPLKPEQLILFTAEGYKIAMVPAGHNAIENTINTNGYRYREEEMSFGYNYKFILQ